MDYIRYSGGPHCPDDGDDNDNDNHSEKLLHSRSIHYQSTVYIYIDAIKKEKKSGYISNKAKVPFHISFCLSKNTLHFRRLLLGTRLDETRLWSLLLLDPIYRSIVQQTSRIWQHGQSTVSLASIQYSEIYEDNVKHCAVV